MSDKPDWWRQPRTVSVVVDNESWILPHAATLVDALNANGDTAALLRSYDAVPTGTAAVFLGCLRKAGEEILRRNRYNLVVHASDLPHGRGFSPWTWAILNGENDLTVCLLEAVDEIDAGPVYARHQLKLEGHELVDEVRNLIGRESVSICQDFFATVEPPEGKPQSGEASIWPRRRPADSRLDPTAPLEAQFNLLRVVDNEKYPAFFDLHGYRYILRIEKQEIPEE